MPRPPASAFFLGLSALATGPFALLGSVVLAGTGSAQSHATRELDTRGAARSSLRVLFDGFVLAPDGVPAQGAVVTSSAGGRAITDVRGRYRLEADVPIAAGIVHITAVGGVDASHSASTRFEHGVASGVARVDPLQLVQVACEPRWLSAFGGQPGVNDTVSALVEFDDGNGPALYAGGSFLIAGKLEANHIARWDGTSWATLGSGLLDVDGGPYASVYTLAVFDDGSGSALFAGGSFRMAGGETATNVARWDGTSWSRIGGVNLFALAMAVFDDGSGPALYVGGGFTNAGGTSANRIARWNGGTSWSALGSGLNNFVYDLAVFDDGAGPALYAAGTFTTAGGVAADRIAKWDGASWSALGTGLGGGASPAAFALAVHDDGGGPALHVGGQFTTAGGVAASHIAKWNGTSWSALGSGLNSRANELTVHDDGSGPSLYVSGGFTTAGGVPANRIARWDGASWSALGAGMDDSVLALKTFDGGAGPVLVAGGDFATAGTSAASRLGTWDGSGWSAFSGPASWLNGTVHAMAVHDDGSGPALHAGGDFSIPGTPAGNRIARRDGASWSALGTGMNGVVTALAVHDDGSGRALYAGGGFTSAGGIAANRVARWDGSSWSALGSGLNGGVDSLATFDDGSGPALYAGGEFTSAGGIAANRVARWNGTGWSALGGGMDDRVECLAVYDDGGGPALYAGGWFFDAGGVAVNQVAKWDGSSWTDLDGGINELFDTMAVYDDGSGPALYVSMTDGFISPEIWKWDGSSWTFFAGVGGGFDGGRVSTMTAHDDGSGSALFISGDFTNAGGVAALGIARWDGSSWTPLGSGVIAGATSLFGHDSGMLKGLYAGALAPHSGDGPVARWGCVPVNSAPKVRRR